MNRLGFALSTFASVCYPLVTAAQAQESAALGELRGGDTPELRARLLPATVVPLIVEGSVEQTPHGAPGAWSGYWKEAAQPYGTDLCRRRTHYRSFFNLEAGKPGASDAMQVEASHLYSLDSFALIHPRTATKERCGGQTIFFQSPETRLSVDFDMARKLARLIDAARANGPIDFQISCTSDPLVAKCSDQPRRDFAALDITSLSNIDYPMAYKTISEDRLPSGGTTRIRQAMGPIDGKWQKPTFRFASRRHERQVWVVTLDEGTDGQIEIKMRSDFVIY